MMFDKLKAYKVFSNDVIFFKFIMDESDLDSDQDQNEAVNSRASLKLPPINEEFQAEFTHQIFGDEETIFGYKNLKINYYLTPGLLDAYIGYTFSEKISPRKFDGVEPDDIYSQFVEFGCSPGFTRNLNTFCAEKIPQDRLFKPFGQKIHEYQRNLNQGYKFKDITNGNGDDTNTMSTFEIYKVDASMPEFESQKFKDYLNRVQTMLVFYIETSNFIDEEDPKWTHFLLYEKRKTSNSEIRYLTEGYISVYNFYAYPDKTRMRVSQMLILPPYQRYGHGAELLEAVYRDAAINSEVVDVTAEGPSPEFIALRDFVTTKLCASLPAFRDVAKLRNGFSAEMAAAALKNFKIPKLQSRRAYEIIRLANTNENDEKLWGDFRDELKRRFYATFLKFSKYARQSKMLSGDADQEQSPQASKSVSGKSQSPESKSFNFKKAPINKMASLSSRFGFDQPSCSSTSSGNPFGAGGSSSSSSNTGSNPFTSSAPTKLAKISEVTSTKKSVSFVNVKNASYSSNEEEDEDDISDHDQSGGEPQQVDFNKLLISETDRNAYINQQFEDAVKEYRKVTQRLEACRVLPF